MHYRLHYEKFVFCIFTMCPLLRSSRFCHWSISKESVIRFAISLFPTFSLKFHTCAHTGFCIFFVTLLQGMAGNSLLDSSTYMINALTNPNSFGSSVWMIPERKLSLFLHKVQNSLLFILTNISYPSRSLSHFIIWHDK